jgi:hypothetical protein
MFTLGKRSGGGKQLSGQLIGNENRLNWIDDGVVRPGSHLIK